MMKRGEMTCGINPFLVLDMERKPVHRMSTRVHRPLRMPAEQARLPLSEMCESLRRRMRRERRLQPTCYHSRLQLPETHDR